MKYWNVGPEVSTPAACLTSVSSLQFQVYLMARISNYIHYRVWDDISDSFLNFNGATDEV